MYMLVCRHTHVEGSVCVFLDTYMWRLVYACTHMCVCARTCVSYRSMLNFFPRLSPPYLLTQRLSFNPDCRDLARLTDQEAPGIFPSLPNSLNVGVTDAHHCTWIYSLKVGAKDPNSSLHACVASTLPIEPSLWRPSGFL